LLKFLKQMMARIMQIKANKQLAVEMPAKKDHSMKVQRKVVETNSPPQPPNSTTETRIKILIGILLSLRTAAHPRYIQGIMSCGEVSRGTCTEANGCTYNAHHDGDPLVQGSVLGALADGRIHDHVDPETHGSDDTKEGELKADREREDDLVDPIDFHGST
jgi:hypothetical protein